MKRILITGINSYVGNSFAEWVADSPESYSVTKISLRDGTWKEKDFSEFDVVLHVAGIAHVSRDPKMEEAYYRVNRDLTVEVAEKAKIDGVKQFIFMSSIIVYGDAPGSDGMIDRHTIPKPKDFYGDSKLQAEKKIIPLETDDFKIVIIRPPMIYGMNSKGNYPKLAKVAKELPVFPYVENRRSMLHIDNLSEFIRLMMVNEENGLFFPQNNEYVNTSDMVRVISEVHGKKIRLIKIFSPVLEIMPNRLTIINKVFGNLVYDKDMSKYKNSYSVRNLTESIELTESRD